ncbi:uncharacterized protein LOC124260998 [Haliotis rubra]|uniref:uncharacterized protein LOC124260998 n=1 Tax=Haliotis rubra TaxID=36100 RepID=UPI001EE58779|nr:uncharacterized protein LOC124260998 [Haliotis rubra]
MHVRGISSSTMKTHSMLALFLVAVLVSPSASLDTCEKVSPCSCQNSEGLIDLSPLANVEGTAKYADQPDGTGQWYYSFNPCNGFTEGQCNNVAVCQTDKTASYFSLGTQQSAAFITDATRGLQMQYSATTDTTRTSYVSLICDRTTTGSFEVNGENPPGSGLYYFTLRSVYACPGGLDTTTTTTATTAAPSPRPAPTSAPSPFFTLKMVVILLGCVVGCLAILICLAFVGLVTRRSSEQELPLSFMTRGNWFRNSIKT